MRYFLRFQCVSHCFCDVLNSFCLDIDCVCRVTTEMLLVLHTLSKVLYDFEESLRCKICKSFCSSVHSTKSLISYRKNRKRIEKERVKRINGRNQRLASSMDFSKRILRPGFTGHSSNTDVRHRCQQHSGRFHIHHDDISHLYLPLNIDQAILPLSRCFFDFFFLSVPSGQLYFSQVNHEEPFR